MASVPKVSILDYFNIVLEGENGKIESNCKAAPGFRRRGASHPTSSHISSMSSPQLYVVCLFLENSSSPLFFTYYSALTDNLFHPVSPCFTLQDQLYSAVALLSSAARTHTDPYLDKTRDLTEFYGSE
ncbi:hypothetical protein J4Q44_G00265250 [Coregonus suidteri]|uniref:Uncharacterized protein n=1 Tax=Coregonus suidteri TaxID=861788 RepID=A0AAN8QM46_9TELE